VDPSRHGVTPPETPPPVAYLDSSALIKLVAVEAESSALRRELAWPQRTSSLLARVDLRTTARYAASRDERVDSIADVLDRRHQASRRSRTD
jgi:predicted nucleic acid-binding protein